MNIHIHIHHANINITKDDITISQWEPIPWLQEEYQPISAAPFLHPKQGTQDDDDDEDEEDDQDIPSEDTDTKIPWLKIKEYPMKFHFWAERTFVETEEDAWEEEQWVDIPKPNKKFTRTPVEVRYQMVQKWIKEWKPNMAEFANENELQYQTFYLWTKDEKYTTPKDHQTIQWS